MFERWFQCKYWLMAQELSKLYVYGAEMIEGGPTWFVTDVVTHAVRAAHDVLTPGAEAAAQPRIAQQ